MSDHWEYYPCTMGESQAFIFYDHGIREEIDDRDLPYAFKVRLEIKQPNEHGLPSNQEFEALTRFEDELAEQLGQIGSIYVGRVTVDGHRYFTYFTKASEDDISKVMDNFSSQTTYQFGTLYEEDPQKSEYWQGLFPTRHDWQVIQDLKVIESLEDNGDPLEKARRIDHWAYFANQADMDNFEPWLKDNDYSIESKNEPDEEIKGYGIQFYHECIPVIQEISRHTIALIDAAEKFNGEYDGWETSIENAND